MTKLYAYVFPFTEAGGNERALAFCSPGCGAAALDDPPASFKRHFVAWSLRHVIHCYGCGLSIGEASRALTGVG